MHWKLNQKIGIQRGRDHAPEVTQYHHPVHQCMIPIKLMVKLVGISLLSLSTVVVNSRDRYEKL